MGDAFRACHGVRLARHFEQLQTELLQRVERDDPLIALLTPGTRHEDYFSHAYLSRYLGFQLVEGRDLRVIGSRVYMKTLEGRKPIDLMIRCVEGSHCDPLELDPNRFAGPAGLVQALRRNPRLIVNFLGTSDCGKPRAGTGASANRENIAGARSDPAGYASALAGRRGRPRLRVRTSRALRDPPRA